MARSIDPAAKKLFRAVVTYSYTNGTTATYAAGPFSGRRQASAAITRARELCAAYGHEWRTITDAWVEATMCDWLVDE